MAIKDKLKNKTVKPSSATTYANQASKEYDNRILNTGLYDGNNQFSQLIDNTVNSLINGNGYYNMASEQALKNYANDYAVLSGIAANDSANAIDQLGAGYQAGWRNAVAGQALQNNAYDAGAYNLDRMGIVNAINADQSNALAFAGSNAGDLNQMAYDQHQNSLEALQRGRSLFDTAYSKFSGMDVDNYNDAKNAYADIYKVQNDAIQSGKDRSQTDKENTRDYKINTLQANAQRANEKCQKFAEKKDNKGMKNYLDGLVKKGDLTKHQADQLYEANKYVPSSSGGTRGGSSGGGYSSIGNIFGDKNTSQNKNFKVAKDGTITDANGKEYTEYKEFGKDGVTEYRYVPYVENNQVKYKRTLVNSKNLESVKTAIGRRANNKKEALAMVDSRRKNGVINDEEWNALVDYYERLYK